MYPKIFKSRLSNNKYKQRGSMLVIALFVIVVFGLLGLTMTRLLSSSSETVIYEVLGQRALNAAKSGLERCLMAKYLTGSGITVCTAPTDVLFPNVPGLAHCNAIVEPSVDVTVTGNSNTFIYSTFTSTGTCTAGNIIVSRTVYVDALL